MNNQPLSELIGHRVLAVLGTYPQSDSAMDVYICGVEILSDIRLKVLLPNGHALSDAQWVTLHLDNRTGVSEYDAELQVNRLSFKGRVSRISDNEVIVEAIEYQVYYGISVVKEYQRADYQFPVDLRSANALPLSPLSQAPCIDDTEHENKIGVLLTFAEQQPHTTVMAFLSSVEDDIFFITFPSTFKGQVLSRDNRCYFAIDSRATFTFEQAIEWNYSIIRGNVYSVPKGSPLFLQIQALFIAKNPWEVGFFSHPDIQMYHLKAEHVVCPKRGIR
ncbi:Uncharacterised protein [Vibrio cincinnatiensis]|uniref:Uncharacterized protein n=1 Tax=Vibrio cincinnatiensis DSM 19608 TaxID=1123491 RepID=A0A1T4NSS1_VIBCI|nr:hypothetical protein [Vibrio cincinnatiensis]SJZ82177.1 hypothetical protein SAMN02745782_01447 [Vibrio cincinnatiensis DSM 19608]SUP05447.1 Uncharacterised protein [Vibrio cincinnatiensis]